MFFSFRAKLFAISVALLAVFMVITGLYVHETLRGWTESRIEHNLQEQAELYVDLMELSEPPFSDEFIEVLGDRENPRITLIDADGVVVLDTYVKEGGVDALDNHADRPEVQAAVAEGYGLARRYSMSVNRDMLYVASSPADSNAVVRLAAPLSDVDEALAHLRFLLLVAGIFGLFAAILMSSLASKLMSRTLQDLLHRARLRERPEMERSSEGHGSLRDLTRTLEKTLELLADERDRFRAVVDGMSDGLVATDEELRVTLSNRNMAGLIEVDAELEGMSMEELIPAEIVERLVAAPAEGVEFDLDGQKPRRVHVRATPRSESGGFIFVFHDVTALRQLQTIRRDFVANISHELRTPVAVIQANAETLLDGALQAPEHARSFTEGIERNSRRLARLVDELLELSRIEAGERHFDLQPIKLAQLVDRVLSDAPQFDEAQVALSQSVDRDIEVVADLDALEQVLVNLLHNARKYGAADGGCVEVSARCEDDQIVVEVRDDGPGIAEEHRQRVFERFYRVDESRAAHRSGVGLGLSIVKHLVTSMGGAVGYRPAEGGGSVFWFRLNRG